MPTTTPTTPALTLFSLDQFDWRSIAASHPSACVCLSCQRAREERAAETGER
jgi:hypothetical protein